MAAALTAIRVECRKANWDGQQAMPVSEQVITVTEKVVEALFALLPKGTPAPDLIPENDGEICLSWVLDTDRQLSLSVSPANKVNFAGLFGKEGSIHGWRPIDAGNSTALDESLRDIAKYLGRLYPPFVSGRAV